ncbi:MAG: tetratricopeptide repeat protein [Methylovulum sp.]|nr:MAG: tetratricopeptide repeat protein [Methylovulum sp.]
MKDNASYATALFLVSITFGILAFYAVAAFYYPKLYIYGTYEDLYGEWAQTYFFVATFIFSTLNACRKHSPYRWFFTMLAAASFYVFMEEISWGQRLLGFGTPDFFHRESYQDEANIHNLLTGPVDVWTKTLLTYLIACGLVAYGIVFPLALKTDFNPALKLAKWGLPIPPTALIPDFLAAAILEIEPFAFNEAEIAELLVAIAMTYTALYYYLPPADGTTKIAAIAPRLGVFLVVAAVVIITTQSLLGNSAQREMIEHRLANGYDKFVDRYEDHDYTYGVVETLQLYNQLKPHNTVILRKIADNFDVLGEHEKAQQFIQAAIDEGLTRYQQDPNDIQANVSLAKSYRQAGDYGRMEFYSEQAYRLARAKQQENPESAYWAYWLAKACEQAHRQQEALTFYRKAHKLEPGSSHYRDAYHQKKKIMIDYED